MKKLNELFEIPNPFKDPKKKDIEGHMKKIGIKRSDYTINKDYTVDLNGDVSILVRNVEECPVNFNIANGNLIWHYAGLKSMKNLPKIVKGNFSVANNKLTTLEGSQTTMVTGTFNCSGNKLKNLKGSPMKCGGFIAMMCDLESLEGSPEEVYGDFIVANNKLTSLEGSPNKVGGQYDCSDNKLENLNGITPLCKKVRYVGNTIGSIKPEETKKPGEKKEKEDTELHLELEDWKEGDKILYIKQSSKFNNMVGVIRTIDEPTATETEKIYNIFFNVSDNKELDRDGGVQSNAKYLRKYVEKFEVDDEVIYTNQNSKYRGYKGRIESVTIPEETGGEIQYKVQFMYTENPSIINIVSDGNKNMTYVNVGKIKGEDLQRILKEENKIIKHIDNKFKEGQEAYFFGKKVKLIKLNSPQHWLVREIEDTPDDDYGVHYSDLISVEKKKKVEKFGSGDKIIFLDPGGKYDECRGRVTYAATRFSSKGFLQVVDIEIINKIGIKQLLMNVNPSKLERDEPPSRPTINTSWGKLDPKKTGKADKFKKGDKIIYVSRKEDVKNKDLHLCKGEVTLLNLATNYSLEKKTTYDVKFHKQPSVPNEKSVYFIPSINLQLNDNNYKKGDKVIYINDDDADLSGKIGIVTKIEKGKNENTYTITFNNNGTIITVSGCISDKMTKFIKPIGTEVSINNDIIYTKPDSKHFGCKGVVQSYNSNDEKPFEIEIKSKDGKMVKIKTKDENLEFLDPVRIFKKGDKIRYTNPNSYSDGLIGEISSIIEAPQINGEKPKPPRSYNIVLKNDKGHIIYLTTFADNLILLEESDSGEFKFGQAVKYINPDSKYKWAKTGRVGEFQGDRIKDGKRELIVKFDDDLVPFLKLYVDPELVFAIKEPIPKKTVTTTSAYSSGYTAPAKKKKKKEVEPPRKPVLVYNRRNVARKAYKPKDINQLETLPEKKSSELEVGDTVLVTDSLNKKIIGKEGRLQKMALHANGMFEININKMTYWLLANQFKKVDVK